LALTWLQRAAASAAASFEFLVSSFEFEGRGTALGVDCWRWVGLATDRAVSVTDLEWPLGRVAAADLAALLLLGLKLGLEQVCSN
jgi:hypothetical protein